jgi:hypothetical protein
MYCPVKSLVIFPDLYRAFPVVPVIADCLVYGFLWDSFVVVCGFDILRHRSGN